MGKRAVVREDNGISKLPEAIIHHILSLLRPEEAAKTRLLSKAWLSAWHTSPVVRFSEPLFLEKFIPGLGRKMFLNFVNKVMLNYREHNNGISTFKLDMNFDNDSVQLFHEWIKIAAEKGLKKLDINNLNFYQLARITVEAKFLEELILSRCRFEQQVTKVVNVMCRNLQKLDLNGVHLSDEIFQTIISNCRLLENLEIFKCKGLRNIMVNNLAKLKKFCVSYDPIQRVELVDVPNLEVFTCNSLIFLSSEWMPGKLKLFASQNLKLLVLYGIGVTDMFFVDFAIMFPHIEELRIGTCIKLHRVRICSQSLRNIHLIRNKNIEELQIDAPKIVRFGYLGGNIPHVFVTSASSHWESIIDIHRQGPIDTSWFFKLKEMLTNLRQSKIFLGISVATASVTIFDLNNEIRNGPVNPRPEIEKLSIDIHTYGFGPSTIPYSAFLDGCFWTCRPKLIKLGSEFCSPEMNFTQLLLESFMISRNQQRSKLRETKFWLKDLKDVKVVILKRNGFDEWQPELVENWKPLLNLRGSSDSGRAIYNFNLEWW